MIEPYITPSLCRAAKAEVDCDTGVTPPTLTPGMGRRCNRAKLGGVGLYVRCSAAASRAMKAGARGLVVAGSKPGRKLSDGTALPCPSARASPRSRGIGEVLDAR